MLLLPIIASILAATPSHSLDEADTLKRIHSHLIIHDPSSACDEAAAALQQFPEDNELMAANVQALAQLGNEKAMVTAWNRYVALTPKPYENRELLEHMAWGIIAKGATSSSPLVRTVALLGAFFGQDAKGVDILCEHLNDQNSSVRAAAVLLSAQLHDAKLCDEVLRLLSNEKVWKVRLAAIKAAGTMQIVPAKAYLTSIVANDHSTAEEQATAIEALVQILDTVERSDIAKLATSDRAGLRLLACQAVSHFALERDLDFIIPLLQDHSSEVRAAALQTLGTLRTSTYNNIPVYRYAQSMLSDPDPMVGMAAAWVLTLNKPIDGQQAFKRWLNHERREMRIQAAAALRACGKYAFPLTLEAFRESRDPFVRMNLAIGLIGQRIAVDEACEEIKVGLSTIKDRMMWLEQGFFRAITPSDLKYEDAHDQNPETVSQLVQLDLLNLLAIMKCSQAQEAIAAFLQQKSWGITGLASALLLTEGDTEAISLVTNMMSHPTPKVRVQAALVLALWGRGEDAISTLKTVYSTADRELKEMILEGLGKIGAPSTIPFLVERLQEPAQSLRIIAASALLQSLYH